VYLLGFNARDLGHAIVSLGDPDTATNVVTYVPGLGSGFASTASGDLTRTDMLWRQAHQFAPDNKIASIFWMSLSTANNGTKSIGASSPCIYPNGTPPS
jgi:hypothetical protein